MPNQNESQKSKSPQLNRGEELILRRNRKIKKEDPKSFNLTLTKIFSFFTKEIYLRFELSVKPKHK